jgi:hypothetical protein
MAVFMLMAQIEWTSREEEEEEERCRSWKFCRQLLDGLDERFFHTIPDDIISRVFLGPRNSMLIWIWSFRGVGSSIP